MSLSTSTSSSHSLALILKPYQDKIDLAIHDYLENLVAETPLKDACAYALLNGGKRFRPSIVLLVAETLGLGYDATQAALAIEFFHTASLIADDLPCMDDDAMRRDTPSLHVAYDQATALLASYALIAHGYELLVKFSMERASLLAVFNTSINTGLSGATAGQYLDLFPKKLDEVTLIDIIKKKTVTLFEVAFVVGWLFGGGDENKLPLVKEAAEHFGMSFQIVDDFQDVEQDSANGRRVNMVLVCGESRAKELFTGHMEGLKISLDALNLTSKPWKQLMQLLSSGIS